MQQHKRAVGRFRTRNNRPSTLGERALQTEPNAHHGNVEVVGEHQRSYHRQLCLRTRSPLPSSSPLKRTSRVTRTDTATLTPTRRRFHHIRKTKAPRRAGFGPGFGPEVQPEQPSIPAKLVDAVPTEWATTRGLVKPRAHFTEVLRPCKLRALPSLHGDPRVLDQLIGKDSPREEEA